MATFILTSGHTAPDLQLLNHPHHDYCLSSDWLLRRRRSRVQSLGRRVRRLIRTQTWRKSHRWRFRPFCGGTWRRKSVAEAQGDHGDEIHRAFQVDNGGSATGGFESWSGHEPLKIIFSITGDQPCGSPNYMSLWSSHLDRFLFGQLKRWILVLAERF